MRGRDPHLRFLAACLSGCLEEAAICQSSPHWNWETLVAVASAEYVLSGVYRLVQQLDQTSSLTPDVLDVLQTVESLNARRNEIILSQIRELGAAFNSAGIEPVVLKGLAHLLSGLYPDKSFRFLIDIDLLVPESDLLKAVGILERLGYRGDKPDAIELEVNHSYTPLFRAGAVTVDLHHRLGRRVSRVILPEAEVLRDSGVCEFEGVRLRIPTPQHLMIHHIIHSQLHDSYRDRLWPPLRTMYDFVVLQRSFAQQLDWEDVEARFRKQNQLATLTMYILRVEEVLGARRPFPVKLRGIARLRWQRRRILWDYPALRFLDPWWFLSAGLSARTEQVREVLRVPGGARYLVRKFSPAEFFERLKADVS